MTDPKIRYDILANAEGQEDVARLARELEKLDSAIDPEGAARARALAQELEKLGAQRTALESFQRAMVDANEAGKRLEQSNEQLRKLQQALEAVDEPSRRQAGQLQKLGDAATAAASDFAKKTEALNASRSSLEKLGLSSENLAQSEAKLAAGLQATTREVQQFAQQSREVQATIAQTATAARKAGEQIEQSFGVLGIRSITAIEKEIRDTELALSRLETRARAGAVGIDEIQRAAGAAEAKMSRLRAEIAQVQTAPTQFESLTSSINGIIGRFAGLGAAVATVGVAVRPVLEATAALEAMRRTLTTVTGSAQAAADQIEFVRNVAARSGQSFSDVGESYSKFVASALQSGLSLKDTQAVFQSVSLAAGNLGLSSEQSSRALEALSQIASKGVVSMEELRGQLGDALPGVLPLLAKELGLTTSELNKVVESGQLLAGEAIPAIGRALEKLGPQQGQQIDGLRAAWSRFIGVIQEAGVQITEGPFGKAAGIAVTAFAGVLRDTAVVAVAFSETVGATARSVGALVAALTGSFKSFQEFRDAVSGNFEEAGKAVDSFKSRAYGARDATAALTAASADAAAATVLAAGGTERQAQSLAKLILEQGKSVDAAELQTRVTARLVQAAEAEAKALEETVKLVVDEGEARRRTAEIAQTVAAVRARDLAAAEAEVATLRAARQAVLDRVGADEQQLAGAQKYLDSQEKKIKQADAELEKTRALTDVAQRNADAARLAAKMYGDQSAQLGQLGLELEAAQRKYDAIERSFKAGRQTTDDLARADRDLLEAKKLLADALSDQDKATKRTIDSLKAAADVTKAEIQLEITKLEIKKQNLLLQGRDAEAARLDLDIKRLQLTATRASTDAKVAEAKATQELILRQYADAEARKVLTPELRQELNTRYEQQRAIILETEAAKLNEEQQRKNIDAVAAGTGARTAQTTAVGSGTTAVGENSKATDVNTGAANRNRDAVSGLAGEWKKYADALQTARGKMDAAVEAERRRAGLTGSGMKVPADNTLGKGPAGIVDPALAARNASFSNTPFQSGSSAASRNPAAPSTGTIYTPPPDNSGDWMWVPMLNQNAEGGVWRKTPAAEQRDFEAQQARLGLVKDQYGIWRPPAGTGKSGVSPFGGAAGTATPTPDPAAAYPVMPTVTDGDTPGTVGRYTQIPVIGKYEVSFTNDRTGVTTSTYADSPEQAQAWIDNLQQAFRTANGG